MTFPTNTSIGRGLQTAAFRVSARVLLVAALLIAAPAGASAAQVDLAWDASADSSVAGYVISYGTASGLYTSSVNVGNTTSFVVNGLEHGTTYYFVVRAYNSSGDFSAPSNEVRRVGLFIDDPLIPGVHQMRQVHLTELRTRIDALRGARGLPAMSWTPIAAGTTLVRASHIAELRAALTAVYQALGQLPPVFTDPTMTTGLTMIRADHIRELRTAVASLE